MVDPLSGDSDSIEQSEVHHFVHAGVDSAALLVLVAGEPDECAIVNGALLIPLRLQVGDRLTGDFEDFGAPAQSAASR
ncbi:MAG: hypothetical protein R3E58_01695 [Phycisphaerae bacterium]